MGSRYSVKNSDMSLNISTVNAAETKTDTVSLVQSIQNNQTDGTVDINN